MDPLISHARELKAKMVKLLLRVTRWVEVDGRCQPWKGKTQGGLGLKFPGILFKSSVYNCSPPPTIWPDCSSELNAVLLT